MIRKAILVTVFAFALLSVSVFGSAQNLWRLNEFTAAYERLLYELVSYDEMWDEGLEEFIEKENVYYEQWEMVADDGRLEVTMGYRYWLPREHVKQDMSFMGALLKAPSFLREDQAMADYTWIALAAEDLDLEVGNTMQLFDWSRVRVVGERTVAGITGYLLNKFDRETDEHGNMVEIVTSEWVIAPNVGWPLAVTLYRHGEPYYSKTLIEYERK